MDSLTGHNLVDTDDMDTMLSDVADWYGRTPMRTHTVGGNPAHFYRSSRRLASSTAT